MSIKKTVVFSLLFFTQVFGNLIQVEQVQIFSEVLKLNYHSPLHVNIRLCWNHEEMLKTLEVLKPLLPSQICSLSVDKVNVDYKTFEFNSIVLMDLECSEMKSFLRSNFLKNYRKVKWFFFNSNYNVEAENNLMEAVNRLNLGAGSEIFFIAERENVSLALVYQGEN